MVQRRRSEKHLLGWARRLPATGLWVSGIRSTGEVSSAVVASELFFFFFAFDGVGSESCG